MPRPMPTHGNNGGGVSSPIPKLLLDSRHCLVWNQGIWPGFTVTNPSVQSLPGAVFWRCHDWRSGITGKKRLSISAMPRSFCPLPPKPEFRCVSRCNMFRNATSREFLHSDSRRNQSRWPGLPRNTARNFFTINGVNCDCFKSKGASSVASWNSVRKKSPHTMSAYLPCAGGLRPGLNKRCHRFCVC